MTIKRKEKEEEEKTTPHTNKLDGQAEQASVI